MSDDAKEAVWCVLEEFGARPGDKSQFMQHWPDCREFRFQGEFGFGGKVWQPTTFKPATVTAYRESNVDKSRLAEVNHRLLSLAPRIERARKAAK
jgi:hypothetical protein